MEATEQIKDIMLKLIRAEVCDTPFTKAELSLLGDDELRALYVLSKKQDLAHIVGAALERSGALSKDNAFRAAFSKETMLAVYRSERLSQLLKDASAALEEASIPFIPLKGAVLRAYYPEPWHRTSSDIDIFVKKENLQTASRILTEACGYTETKSSSHDLSFRSPDGMHLELHYELIEPYWTKNAAGLLSDPFVDAVPSDGCVYRHEMSDARFYLYHIAHMAKHLEDGGCGVRPFLDLWLLEHRVPHDEDARRDLLERGELLIFANTVKRLAHVWFDSADSDRTLSQLSSLILASGVYGTRETRVRLQQQRKGGKLKYAFSRIFLPYETLKHHYPILKKYPILTPVCEVRRWCRLLFCGNAKRSLNEFKINASVSEEQADGIRDLMEQIGL